MGKNIRLIVEGADGAGKSTLIDLLHAHYELTTHQKIDTLDMRGKDPMTYDFCFQLLQKTRVIFDRQFPSENIYSKFYGMDYRMSEEETGKLVDYCKENNIPIIVCIPKNHRVLDGEDEDIKKEHEFLVSYYKDFCNTYGIVPIDNHKMNLEETVKFIENGDWIAKD